MSSSSLLKFQIGPVQEFIASARSTRDLWSGSYLLSWVMAAGIRVLPDDSLIFPNKEGQPLTDRLTRPLEATGEDLKRVLTPNLPNLFVARVPSDQAADLAKVVKKAIEDEWNKIAEACWKKLNGDGIVPSAAQSRFKAQVKRHLAISWQTTAISGSYADAYEDNGWHLDSVRQLREFEAWDPSGGDFQKDSLSGVAEVICGGSDFKTRMHKRNDAYSSLFKHEDHLGAVALIKRVWHLAYLGVDSAAFPIRSTHAIAARSDKLDDMENTDLLADEKYLAAIAFDGDSIGRWVSGERLESKERLESFHSDFSSALSGFALVEARRIIESTIDGKDQSGKEIKVPLGFLIYAGGDDVVALVPADQAIKVAGDIRQAFRESTKRITGKNQSRPDGSAGIAIAHFKAPLQDLIREAQKAEKRAKRDPEKGGYGRSAVAITLMKRSGEITEWGCKWSEEEGKGGLDLYQEIASLMNDEKLSSRFPHRVCQMLTPYLTQNASISQFADAEGFPVHEIITREVLLIAERQGSKRAAENLEPLIAAYLGCLRTNSPSTVLKSIIGLCTTVAFSQRTRSESSATKAEKAERQLAL